MSAVWLVVAAALAAAVAGMVAAIVTRRAPSRLVVANHAGRPTPVVLGISAYVALVSGSVVAAFGSGIRATAVVTLVMIGVIFVIALAGALDDLFAGTARGLGGHLRSMGRGRPTTGILKLIVGVALAVVTALHLSEDPVRIAATVVLIATATNLWNALDVRPGRALKWAVLVLFPVAVASSSRPSAPVFAAAVGAIVGLLPFDLGERGMLGDAGSNPLGFLAGLGLAVVLPTAGVVVAALIVLALQVAAETVTISRLIDAVPPLRWFDRLGRRREVEPAAR